MASRFYLPASGTAAVSPAFDATWDVTTTSPRRPLTSGGSTSLATQITDTETSAGPQDVLSAQFVSAPIAAQTITGTMSVVIPAVESNASTLAYLEVVVRVVSNDGQTVRGTLYSGIDGTELAWPAVATRIFNAVSVTSVAALTGDRIVVEMGAWFNNVTASARSANIRYGDLNTLTDYALTSALTTTVERPWVEFSQTITPQITVVGAAGNNSGSASNSTVTVTLPAGIAEGDVGFLAITGNSGTTAPSVNPPTGWVAASTASISSTTVLTTRLYTRTMAAADSSTVVSPTLSAAARWGAGVVVLRGVMPPLDALNAPAATTADSTTLTVPAVTPVANDCYRLVIAGIRQATSVSAPSTVAPPAGWTEHVDTMGTNTANPNTGVWIAGIPMAGQAAVAQATTSATLSLTGRHATYSLTVAPITARIALSGSGTLTATGVPAFTATVTNRAIDPSLEVGTTGGTSNNAALYPATGDTSVFYAGARSFRTDRASTLNSTLASVLFGQSNVASTTRILCSAGEVVSTAIRIRSGVDAQAKLDIVFRNAAGTTISTSLGTQINLTAGVWTEVKQENATAPALTTYVFATTQVTTRDGSNTTLGVQVWFDGFMFNTGASVFDYFDGASTNGAWTGTANASASTLTQVPSTASGTLAGTGAPTPTGTATLAGSGSLTATGVPEFTGTATLSGSGTLAATGAPGPTGNAALTGDGALAADGTPTPNGAAALTAEGTLAASGVAELNSQDETGTATLTGSGTLTATGTPAETGTATLTGTGTLTGSGVATVAHTGTATLTGTGTLTATGTPTTAGTAALTGSGALTGTATSGNTGTAQLTGSGALAATAAPTVNADAPLAGAGTLTTSAAPGAAGTALLTGSGTLTATGVAGRASRDITITAASLIQTWGATLEPAGYTASLEHGYTAGLDDTSPTADLISSDYEGELVP